MSVPLPVFQLRRTAAASPVVDQDPAGLAGDGVGPHPDDFYQVTQTDITDHSLFKGVKL